MEKLLKESNVNFAPIRKFKGVINRVETKDFMGTITKDLYIDHPKQYNLHSRKYERLGKLFEGLINPEHLKKFTLRVELRKKWAKLDVFPGLEIGLYGSFTQESFTSIQKVMIVPSQGKNNFNLNFLVIEPDL